MSITHDDRIQQQARETNNSSTNLNNTTISNNAVIFSHVFPLWTPWHVEIGQGPWYQLNQCRSQYGGQAGIFSPHFSADRVRMDGQHRSGLSQKLNGWIFRGKKHLLVLEPKILED